MKKLEKTAVLLVSLLLTLIGFNLIAAPAFQILQIARLTGHQVIADYLVANGTTDLIAMGSLSFRLPAKVFLAAALYAVALFIIGKFGSGNGKTGNRHGRKPDNRNSRLGPFNTPQHENGV